MFVTKCFFLFKILQIRKKILPLHHIIYLKQCLYENMLDLNSTRYGSGAVPICRGFTSESQLLTQRGYVFFKDLTSEDRAWNGETFEGFTLEVCENVDFPNWYLEVDGGASVNVETGSKIRYSNKLDGRNIDACFSEISIEKMVPNLSVMPHIEFPVLKGDDSYVSERAVLDAYVQGCVDSKSYKTYEDWNKVCQYSFAERLSWLEGFVKSNGSFSTTKGKYKVLQFSGSFTFLQGLMLLLQTLGVNAKISRSVRLIVSHKNLQKLLSIGFKNERIERELSEAGEIRDKLRFNKLVTRKFSLRGDDSEIVYRISSTYPIVVNGIVFG